MYRILIVDDEPMIVEGLCALFEEQDAVQLEVYKACLAAEALGIMNRRRIDILLTDIRMPAVSGIELMQRVRANWPACRIIFLTAFEEFEYAYAALKNPGVRFLLKTESHEAILRAVSECVAELEAVLREKLLRQRSAEQSGVIRALRARELFSRLLHVGEAEVTQALLDELGLPLCTGEPVYLLLGLPAAPQEEALLQMDRITGGLTVRAGTKARCAAHKDGSGVLVWFLQENRAEMAEITQALPVLLADELEAMEEAYQADTVFVLAARPCAWDQLAHAYQRLKAVLHLKASAGKRLVYVADGEETSAGESEALRRSEACKRRIRQLGAALEAGDGPAAAAALRNVCACILEIGAQRQALGRALAMELSLCFLALLGRLPAAEESEPLQNGVRWLCSAEPALPDERRYLALAEAVLAFQRESGRAQAADCIEKVKAYICGHLDADLSLSRLAQLSNYNPKYLSDLFSAQTGVNLSDYIAERRLEEAKRLIAGGTMKMKDIAAAVGFFSSSYFTRFFKKALGITPVQYQERLLRKELDRR
ncbi:MAG: response regulator [Acutalibacteraceae bacterium]